MKTYSSSTYNFISDDEGIDYDSDDEQNEGLEKFCIDDKENEDKFYNTDVEIAKCLLSFYL